MIHIFLKAARNEKVAILLYFLGFIPSASLKDGTLIVFNYGKYHLPQSILSKLYHEI